LRRLKEIEVNDLSPRQALDLIYQFHDLQNWFKPFVRIEYARLNNIALGVIHDLCSKGRMH
jgi:hypothetical protein